MATIGDARCLNPKCGREIPAGESSKGALTLSCGWCGLSAFAKAGTKAADDLRPAAPAASAAAGAASSTAPAADKRGPFGY